MKSVQDAPDAVTSLPFAPQKIACGFYHSAAICNCGDSSKIVTPSLYAWGRNKYSVVSNQYSKPPSKPGVSPDEDKLKPDRVPGLEKEEVYEIGCGTHHMVCLLKSERDVGGKVFSCGLGKRGRLGWAKPGGNEQVEEAWWSEDGPKEVPLGRPILRIVCGSDHTLAFATDGRLYAWGANNEGQCGVDTKSTDDLKQPYRVDLASEKPITHFAAGAEHSLCAVGEEGELWAWGCGRNGRLGLGNSETVWVPTQVACPTTVVFVACGEGHSGCVDAKGAVMMWGAGSYGRLGHGEEIDVAVPKEVFSFQEMVGTPDDRLRLRKIALGGFHTLFLEDTDAKTKSNQPPRLLSCGAGAATGLFAEGSAHDRVPVPKFVQYSKNSNVAEKRIVQISAGMYHSMILLKAGYLIVWGVGSNGRLGDERPRPMTIWEPTELQSTFGFNSFRPNKEVRDKPDHQEGGPVGQRLKHTTEKRPDEDVEATGKLTPWDIKQFSCGAIHTLFLTNGGKLYATGCNANGQLGMGFECPYVTMAKRITLSHPVLMVAAGYEHCLAVTCMHEVFSWGKGTSGQLGSTYSRDEFDPIRIDVRHPVIFCAAGEDHSAVIGKPRNKEEPTRLWTFGSADSGLLGLGEQCQSGTRSGPSEVTFDKQKWPTGHWGPVFVSCGSSHTMVIIGPCEGDDVLYKDPMEPVPQWARNKQKLPGERKAKRLLLAFGNGWNGKLGIGGTANAYSPTPVVASPNPSSFDPRQVCCGAHHTCCVTQNCELWAWGRGRNIAEPSIELIDSARKFPHVDSPLIVYVTCCESHTLAIAKDGYVFAWGDNRSGQLALSSYTTASEIPVPLQVLLEAGPVLKISTGTGHTVALFQSNRVQGWGDQRCGRLGLDDPKQEAIVSKASDLEAVWSSIEERGADTKDRRRPGDTDSETELPDDANEGAAVHRDADADPKDGSDSESDGPADFNDGAMVQGGPAEDEAAQDSSKDLFQQKVTAFSTIQSLIKQEPPHHQEANLKGTEKKLEDDLKRIISQILKLPEREDKLKLLQGDFESSLLNNLKFIPKIKAPAPGDFQIHSDVATKLPVYEKLLWLLQQQVNYLAELSVCIQGQEEQCKVYYQAVKDIYGEPHKRTQNLFESFLRLVLDKETENSVSGIYSRESGSRAFFLFKDFVLSERFYPQVVHPLVKMRKQGEHGDPPSLVEVLKTHWEEHNTFFALNPAHYKEVQPEEDNAQQDVELGFQSSRDSFKTFLEGPFLEVVKGMQLPDDIKRILNHVKFSVQNRPLSNSGTSFLSGELKRLEPLLTLFVQGILRPVLGDLDEYGSSRYYVSTVKTLDASLLDLIRTNMKTISMFLDKMMGTGDAGFNSKREKMFDLAASKVKSELLKWLKQEAETVEDNLEIELMMDTYEAHYDRSPHPVTINYSDLLRLSNMLKSHMTKLRIKESDPLEEYCMELRMWPEDFIVQNFDKLTAKNNRRNFILNTRFLFTYNPYEKEDYTLEVCKSSKCPLPRRLVGQALCDGLIRSHQEHPDDPQKVLERLFRSLEESVMSVDFHAMGNEFDRLRENYKHRNPPDFRMVHALQDGLRVIEELRNSEARPEEVLDMMKNALVARSKQNSYLTSIEKGIKNIDKLAKKYEEMIKQQVWDLEQALDFSLTLNLPGAIVQNAKDANRTLAFQDLKAKIEKQRAFDPQKLMKIGCTPVPMESYPMSTLQRKQAIIKVHPPYNTMEKNMMVTLRAPREGGIEIVANVVQRPNSMLSTLTGKVFNGAKPSESTVKRLYIQQAQMQEMMRGDGMEEVKLYNKGEDEKPFFTCKAGPFVQLVSELQAKIA